MTTEQPENFAPLNYVLVVARAVTDPVASLTVAGKKRTTVDCEIPPGPEGMTACRIHVVGIGPNAEVLAGLTEGQRLKVKGRLERGTPRADGWPSIQIHARIIWIEPPDAAPRAIGGNAA